MPPIPYLLLCLGLATIFCYLTWPGVEGLLARRREPKNPPPVTDNANDPPANANQPAAAKPREPGITVQGTYIYATPEKIIIWTTIKLTDESGKETYLKRLGVNNFSILESYAGTTKAAPVLQVVSSKVPVKAILVIDKSGSMNEPSGIGGAKIDVIKKAAVFFVGQLTQSDTNSVAILPFSGEGVSSANFLRSQDGDVWSNGVEKDYLVRSINRLSAVGNTPLWQAVGVALDQLAMVDDASYKVVICLSDGKDNLGRQEDYNSLLVKARQKQIPIFTIGYGTGDKLNGRELVQLSAESGAGKETVGSFIQVPPSEWTSHLQSIGTDLANLYELYWEPTGAPPATRVGVEIKVSYEFNGRNFEAIEHRSYELPQK